MRLFAVNNTDDAMSKYAAYIEVVLSLRDMKWLLAKYQDFSKLFARDPETLYTLEHFNNNSAYSGTYAANHDAQEETWYVVDGKRSLLGALEKVSCPTVHIMKDGVIWQAMPDADQGFCESPMLSWDVLRAAVAGDDIDLDRLTRE